MPRDVDTPSRGTAGVVFGPGAMGLVDRCEIRGHRYGVLLCGNPPTGRIRHIEKCTIKACKFGVWTLGDNTWPREEQAVRDNNAFVECEFDTPTAGGAAGAAAHSGKAR